MKTQFARGLPRIAAPYAPGLRPGAVPLLTSSRPAVRQKCADALGVIRNMTVLKLSVVDVYFVCANVQFGHLSGEWAVCGGCRSSGWLRGCLIPLRVIGKIEIPGAGDIRWH